MAQGWGLRLFVKRWKEWGEKWGWNLMVLTAVAFGYSFARPGALSQYNPVVMPDVNPEAGPGARLAGSRSMLLVEDNEDDVFLLQRALKYAGIENPLHIVQDGEAALAYLSGAGVFADRTQHPLPFIVFLDLKLPYLNGFEVLTWL